MQRSLLVLILFAGLSWAAQASDIYRWKDENGRTHFGDTVPEKYRSSATKVAAPSPAPHVTAIESPKPPPPVTGVEPDCATAHRLYRESQECFAPFMTPYGPRPEAFRHCTERRDPSYRCGPPPRWDTSERHQLKPDSSERHQPHLKPDEGPRRHFDRESSQDRPVQPESSERRYVQPVR